MCTVASSSRLPTLKDNRPIKEISVSTSGNSGTYIDVGEPVPVLPRGDSAELVSLIGAAQEPSWVQVALHGHNHGTALVLF